MLAKKALPFYFILFYTIANKLTVGKTVVRLFE